MMFDSVLYDVGVCLLVLLSILYLFVKERFGYFKRRGIPYDEPLFLLGSTWRNMLGRENLVDACARIYDNHRGKPFVGIYQGMLPAILVRDPQIVEKVLVKDFSTFHDRGIPFDEVSNPLEGHLFNLTGTKWKALRSKLVPSFSSGKLKGMLSTMQGSIKSFVNDFESKLGDEMEMKTEFTRLSFHIIGTCAFGLDLDTIKNPNSKFPQICKTIFARDPLTFAKGVFRFFFPRMAKFFGIRLIAKETNDFFMDLVKDSFEQRTKLGIRRNDFLQLLLELKQKGQIDVDENDESETYQTSQEDFGKFELTDEVLTAQAFVFFSGGFETSSTALGFLFYFLSKNHEAQEKLRQEINAVKKKYGDFTYDALKAMVYADACINESMRLYPPAGVLVRKCNKPIDLSPGMKIEKDTLLFVPIFSIQRDEEYFSKAHSFNPDRFINSPPSSCTFLPFGDGPRICIAQRFAYLLIKATIAEILFKYKVETCAKMQALEPIKLRPRAFVTTPRDGLHCVLRKLT